MCRTRCGCVHRGPGHRAGRLGWWRAMASRNPQSRKAPSASSRPDQGPPLAVGEEGVLPPHIGREILRGDHDPTSLRSRRRPRRGLLQAARASRGRGHPLPLPLAAAAAAAGAPSQAHKCLAEVSNPGSVSDRWPPSQPDQGGFVVRLSSSLEHFPLFEPHMNRRACGAGESGTRAIGGQSRAFSGEIRLALDRRHRQPVGPRATRPIRCGAAGLWSRTHGLRVPTSSTPSHTHRRPPGSPLSNIS